MNTTAVTVKAGIGAVLATAATYLFALRLSILLADVDSIVSGTASVNTQVRTVIELFIMTVGTIAAVWWALSYLLVLAALAAGTTSMVGRGARALVQRYGSRSARAMLASAAGMTLAFGAVPATAAPMFADSAPTSSTQQAADVTGTATPLTFLSDAGDTEAADTTDEDSTQADATEDATGNDSQSNTPDSTAVTDQEPTPGQNTPEQQAPEAEPEAEATPPGDSDSTTQGATDIPTFAENTLTTPATPTTDTSPDRTAGSTTTQAVTHTPATKTHQAPATDTSNATTSNHNNALSLLMLADHTAPDRTADTTETADTADTPSPSDQDSAQTVQVTRGDSLWSITSAALPEGSTDTEIAAAWPAVYDENRDVIGGDPDNITPGTTITIPTTLNSATSNATAK